MGILPSRRRSLPFALAVCLAVMGGCADNSMVLQGNVQNLQQQQMAMQRQNYELNSRVASLDQNNQELNALIAQVRQQAKLAEDRARLMQGQLASANDQLEKLRDEKKQVEARTEALTASMQRQSTTTQRQRGITITPNNSYLATMPTINLRGVEVRRDGDVIRIELPSDQLFQHGTNQFQANAGGMITTAAAEILRNYPNQKIGIEGHTDTDPVQNYQFHNNTQLSIAQASAVHDILLAQTRIKPGQLFLVGHGGNHPVVSNATAAGKHRNRRIELVIYPERAG